ncbi:Eukaryotic peptide chain release factor GTP-binding subunit like [Actinidia chinensis var. chinensis]|uniref:Eukaryotic peptide chain release factor GTP-binding subunit like n=1 Tax=Actinidia chinensis var. chinensis TaxID=1590841 RepID=A0A2R6R5J5_ACTCC|nr:Eukaryotic peptide chain release factor GTP-binding subunit like [Actinidia chinensis var. chinensis]
MKPSRSDEVLDADEQARMADRVRAQFDSMAPKRPTKPNRSESDSTPTPLSEENTPTIPEFQKFQSLQSQSQALFSETKIEQLEEFVETQYYKQLDSVDKQHHTTGSGFIKLSSSECGGGGEGNNLQLQNGYENGERVMVLRTNPATNDWIPNMEDHQVIYVSGKPNRSDSG